MEGSPTEAPAPAPRVGDVVELRIDALAAGGDGVGRTAEGRVVFVPLTAPGDRVRARLERLHPRYARAEIESIVEPGPGRVAPRCGVFGLCGGCSWQHLDYAVQCEAKRRIVEDALRRVGHLDLRTAVTLQPSPSAYGYRARARVAIEAGEVGYRRRRSRALCAVRRCPILAAPLEAQLGRLADAPPAGEEEGEWEIAVGASGGRVHAVGAPADAIELFVDEAQLRVSAGVFFQAHRGFHVALIESVARAAGSGALAVELFAGAGFFTLRLARSFDRVIAVEADAAAVADLRHNLARAGRSGVEVVHDRVEAVLAQDLPQAGRTARQAVRRAARRSRAKIGRDCRAKSLLTERMRVPDVVVLDPPRTGLPPGAAEPLCALAPSRIVYLSCDPATLARDLAALVAGGFTLEAVEAFDLFPQTPHVEVLACLRASGLSARSERKPSGAQ